MVPCTSTESLHKKQRTQLLSNVLDMAEVGRDEDRICSYLIFSVEKGRVNASVVTFTNN